MPPNLFNDENSQRIVTPEAQAAELYRMVGQLQAAVAGLERVVNHLDKNVTKALAEIKTQQAESRRILENKLELVRQQVESNTMRLSTVEYRQERAERNVSGLQHQTVKIEKDAVDNKQDDVVGRTKIQQTWTVIKIAATVLVALSTAVFAILGAFKVFK